MSTTCPCCGHKSTSEPVEREPTYVRDGGHVLVGKRRPLAKDADLRPDSLFKKRGK